MRRIAEIEPKVRAFCVATLDPLIDHGSFDFVADFGSEIPMRTIGMMLGIPDADQPQHRQRIDEGFKLDSGDASPTAVRRCSTCSTPNGLAPTSTTGSNTPPTM